MQQLDSEPVARVKTLLLFAVLKQPDPPISQHTVTIHQEQLDARGSFLNFRASSHLEEFDAGEFPARRCSRKHQHSRAGTNRAEFARTNLHVGGDQIRD